MQALFPFQNNSSFVEKRESFEGTVFPRGATLAALCHEVELTACSWLVTKMTRIKYTFTSFLFDLYFILVYTSCYKDSV